jgi:hypothetical protein
MNVQTYDMEQIYEGPFELVGHGPRGEALFESAQAPPYAPSEHPFALNTVRWSVDKEGRIVGSAQFIEPETYDFVSAKLEGHTPEPPPGQGYRDAFVDVRFVGGSRRFRGASGEAKVEAKLYDDGMSRGVIRGTVALTGER